MIILFSKYQKRKKKPYYVYYDGVQRIMSLDLPGYSVGELITFFSRERESKNDKKVLQCLRYFICFDFQRVKIFHKWVENDKQSLGISTESSRPTALLNIRRSRILEVSVQTPFLKPLLRSLFVKDYKPNLCLAKLISLSNKLHI